MSSPIPVLIVTTFFLQAFVDFDHILQVGAGPSGLVSALVLAHNSIQVRIVDKTDRYHVGSRGFGVQAKPQPYSFRVGYNI